MNKIKSDKTIERYVAVKNIQKDTILLQRLKAVGTFTNFADIYFVDGQSNKIKFSGAINQ